MACCVALSEAFSPYSRTRLMTPTKSSTTRNRKAQGTEGKKLADSCVPVTAAHRGLPGTDVTVVIQLNLRVEWDSDRMTHAGR